MQPPDDTLARAPASPPPSAAGSEAPLARGRLDDSLLDRALDCLLLELALPPLSPAAVASSDGGLPSLPPLPASTGAAPSSFAPASDTVTHPPAWHV
jgi:hypothetical protein